MTFALSKSEEKKKKTKNFLSYMHLLWLFSTEVCAVAMFWLL